MPCAKTKPPFSPEAVVGRFAALLKSYGVSGATATDVRAITPTAPAELAPRRAPGADHRDEPGNFRVGGIGFPARVTRDG